MVAGGWVVPRWMSRLARAERRRRGRESRKEMMVVRKAVNLAAKEVAVVEDIVRSC